MRILTLSILFCAFWTSSKSQSSEPQAITAQMIEQFKADIEKSVPALKLEYAKQELNADEVEFSVDTFRIEQLAAKKIAINYSTLGMNTAVNDLTESYDQLMNKYYNRLLKLLEPEDKKILIHAQQSWLSFRDAEEKLVIALTNKTYSGGGTIQSIIATGSYSELVTKRCIKIFSYYNNIIKKS